MEILEEIRFTHDYWMFLLPLIGAGADILTGLLQAGINNCYSSSVMRKGLYRKLGELGCVLLAFAVSKAIVLPVNVTAFVSVYITLMEVISVLENLAAAGVPFPVWIIEKLKKTAEKISEDKDA